MFHRRGALSLRREKMLSAIPAEIVAKCLLFPAATLIILLT